MALVELTIITPWFPHTEKSFLFHKSLLSPRCPSEKPWIGSKRGTEEAAAPLTDRASVIIACVGAASIGCDDSASEVATVLSVAFGGRIGVVIVVNCVSHGCYSVVFDQDIR